MVMAEFTPRAIKRRRPDLERIVIELLDAMAAGPQPVELVSAYALPIPSTLIATMLGVPVADRQTFQQHNHGFMKPAPGQDPMVALVELTSYLDALVRQKEQDPGEDLTSELAVKYWATGELSHDDLVAMIRMLLIAGFETTGNQLALSILTLIRHPDQVTAMLEDPARQERVIEELLRYWSIAQDNQVRVTNRDCEIGGVMIPAGAGVVFAIPAANHDESVFACPERFEPDREACPNLAFGQGPHYCPGAPLARLEMEVGLAALFQRFPTLQPVSDVAQLSFRNAKVTYGLDELWVRW
jgi:cytochrome P450